MRHRILVEITLDKQPQSSSEVQTLLDDITENYGRATAAFGFTPRIGPAFVESVRLMPLSRETAKIAAEVLEHEQHRLADIASRDSDRRTSRDIADRASRLRTAAAFMSGAVQS